MLVWSDELRKEWEPDNGNKRREKSISNRHDHNIRICIIDLPELMELLRSFMSPAVSCAFKCLRSELGCVYVLPQPRTWKKIRLVKMFGLNGQMRTLQRYGLSVIWTFECFFLSELLAKRRSHPLNSHLNGFSPEFQVRNYCNQVVNYLYEFACEFSNSRFAQMSSHSREIDTQMASRRCERECGWRACTLLWTRSTVANNRPSSKCDRCSLFGITFKYVQYKTRISPGPPTWSIVIWWTTSHIYWKYLPQWWPWGISHLHWRST